MLSGHYLKESKASNGIYGGGCLSKGKVTAVTRLASSLAPVLLLALFQLCDAQSVRSRRASGKLRKITLTETGKARNSPTKFTFCGRDPAATTTHLASCFISVLLVFPTVFALGRL
jgi:hypothetical protein